MLAANFYPFVGGAERQCLKLSKKLIQMGHEVTVITRRLSKQHPVSDDVDGVAVRRIPAIRPFEAAAVFWTMYLLKERNQFDILHGHMLHEHTTAAWLAAALTGKPFIIKLASSGPFFDPLQFKLNGRKPFNHLVIQAMRRADKIVSICQSITMELQQWGVDETKIASILNGVEIPSKTVRLTRDEQRSMLGIAEDETVVLRVGTFHPSKNVERLVEAWQQVIHRNPKAVLISVGGAEIPKHIQRMARGLGDRIRFIPNIPSGVDPYFIASDIFVLPSITEGLSNALLEAQTFGLPAVVSNVGGNVDVVQPGVNGILIDPSNTRGITDALVAMIENKPLRESMAGQAVAISKRYHMDRVADAYENLYQKLIDAKKNIRLRTSH